jgi:RES domain-containing protein
MTSLPAGLTPHVDFSKIRTSLQRLVLHAVPFRQHVYRMINPRYCKNADILNGVGGLRANGRWNIRRPFHCTYTSCSPETALAEVLNASRHKGLPDATALPRVLVCLGIEVQKSLDLTNGSVRQSARLARRRMVDEQWWSENQSGREAWTQAIGRAAAEIGFEAIIAPSHADPKTGTNVIVFPENLGVTSRWAIITPVPLK